MKRWKLLNIGDTEVYIHAATLLCWLYTLVAGHGRFMIVATLSILFHETAHGLVAALFGASPASLELTPMGALLRLEDENRLSRIKQLLVVLAGPTVTWLLAAAALLLTKNGALSIEVGSLLFLSNVSILLINLLPTLPLDGGRVLALLLCTFLSIRSVSRILRGIGYLIGISLIGLNIYTSWQYGGWNLSLAFAGCCVLYCASAGTTTQAMAQLRIFMNRKIRLEQKGYLEIKQICALGHMPLRKLVHLLPTERMAEFICIEAGTMHRIGSLAESEMIQLYLSRPELSLKTAVILSQTDDIIPK